jgi:hypothetical protein
MTTENAAIPMRMENASTPQLDAMYSQGGSQQYEQPAQMGHGQQGFVQQPQVFHDGGNGRNEQMQQAPQNFAHNFPAQEYHQQAQFDP